MCVWVWWWWWVCLIHSDIAKDCNQEHFEVSTRINQKNMLGSKQETETEFDNQLYDVTWYSNPLHVGGKSTVLKIHKSKKISQINFCFIYFLLFCNTWIKQFNFLDFRELFLIAFLSVKSENAFTQFFTKIQFVRVFIHLCLCINIDFHLHTHRHSNIINISNNQLPHPYSLWQRIVLLFVYFLILNKKLFIINSHIIFIYLC